MAIAIPIAAGFSALAIGVTLADTRCSDPRQFQSCIRQYFPFILRAHPSGIAEIHIEQAEINELVANESQLESFLEVFEHGDEMFSNVPSAAEGSGANVDGKGQRFTRVPRADLNGPGQWNQQTPRRPTGPNSQGCVDCHNVPFEDGAGEIANNVHRDPQAAERTGGGRLDKMISRNTPHLFAPGAIQVLAEEMTEELHRDRANAAADACSDADGISIWPLEASGVKFGTIIANRTQNSPCRVTFDTSRVEGVDGDLVVKPFQWKGANAFLRDFNRGASNNELGMQPEELAAVNGQIVDGDADGVLWEIFIGDQTAMAIYLAGQPRPTTRVELSSLGLLDPPITSTERSAISRGSQVFASIGCATCHTPSHTLGDPFFHEPSQNPNFRDGTTFPGGQGVLASGLDFRKPVKFDLTKDQPNNQITDANGKVIFRLGSLRKNSSGRALVENFGDLKRHDLGPEVAEQIDEIGTGASVFLTENLWGVGSTAPYMHDGRATTLTEAILFHGGEATSSRAAFNNLSDGSKLDLIAFLNNQVLFKIEEEEE